MTTPNHKTPSLYGGTKPPLAARGRLLRWIGGGLIGMLLVIASLQPLVEYWMRHQVFSAFQNRFGCTLQVDRVALDRRAIHLYGLVVHPHREDLPHDPARFEHIEIEWNLSSLWKRKLLVRSIRLENAHFQYVRHLTGKSNLSHILHQLQTHSPGAAASSSALPSQVVLTHATVHIQDDLQGTVEISHLEGNWSLGKPAVFLAQHVRGTSLQGPTLQAAVLRANFAPKPEKPWIHLLPTLSVEGGSFSPWPSLSLTGIHGTIETKEFSTVGIRLAGGYGFVPKDLWEATGTWVPTTKQMSLQVSAQRFHLSALDPILKQSPFIERWNTEIDANLQMDYKNDVATTEGSLHIKGLSLFIPKLAAQPLRNLHFDVTARARLEHKDHFVLEHSRFQFEKTIFALTLDAKRRVPPPKQTPGPPYVGSPIKDWRQALQQVRAELVIEPVACQDAFTSIPESLVPKLQGMKWVGTLQGRVKVFVDMERLLQTPPGLEKRLFETVQVDGSPGIQNCRVREAPTEVDTKLLRKPFVHFVATKPNELTPWMVGPENPDFVPFSQISPHLINAILTTEDSTFMRHHGFISSEVATALARNLRAGAFRFGASSISMQLAKNLFLSREKTLSRKLQEAILTVSLEQNLGDTQEKAKQRELEIYFNVIEFGPGLYGIGPAARHYFGKTAAELTPREAAWFSSILPNPKQRHIHYCHGAPTSRWESYLDRILRRMYERDRLNETEFSQALQERLSFDRTDWESEAKCKNTIQAFLEAEQLPPAEEFPEDKM